MKYYGKQIFGNVKKVSEDDGKLIFTCLFLLK